MTRHQMASPAHPFRVSVYPTTAQANTDPESLKRARRQRRPLNPRPMLRSILPVFLVSSAFAILGVGRQQAAGVRGQLMCDNQPAANVKVKLYDDNSMSKSYPGAHNLQPSASTNCSRKAAPIPRAAFNSRVTLSRSPRWTRSSTFTTIAVTVSSKR